MTPGNRTSPLSERHTADELYDHALERFPDSLREALKKWGTVREFKRGTTLLAPGEGGDRIGFLLAGRADVVLHEEGHPEIPVESLSEGSCYGEINFLTGRRSPPNWMVKAVDDCVTVELPAKYYEETLAAHPDVGVSMLRSLAGKVVRLDRNLFESKRKKRALQHLISKETLLFPEYVVGDHLARRLDPRIEELALSGGPVLVVGENGVGKEVIAHSIFQRSHRFREVFLLIDAPRIGSAEGAIVSDGAEVRASKDPKEILLRMFFGEEQVGPNGNAEERLGYVELCEGGTLLVRGIERIDPAIQRLLLEAWKTGKFERPGSGRIRGASFRIIVTTELDLSAIDPDLHPLAHSLKDRSVVMPPLRERHRELPALANNYLARHAKELGKEFAQLPKQTIKTLLSYSWPGNDLELSSTLRRALLVAPEGVVRPNDIYFDVVRAEGPGKLNLLRFKPIRQMVLSPLFPAILQSAAAPFFVILLGLLLLGPPDPLENPASLFSWALGWPALVGMAVLWARHWCSICPMGVIGRLAKGIGSLDLPFPAALKDRSELLVVAAVLFIIWLEAATGMRSSPFRLGILLLTITIFSVAFSMIFERQSWCRYLCPLGGMTGAMAMASVIELRADRNVCSAQCSSHECHFGTKTREGCPFGHVTPTLHSNLTCKLCGICVKNCPHAAINLNLRIPGQELMEMSQVNVVTAFLAVAMIGALLSELVSKAQFFEELIESWGLPEVWLFTVLFLALILGTTLLVALAARISCSLSRTTFRENYARYGLALLPLTLTFFLAYHLYYFINLGILLPALVSRQFDLAIFKQLIITVPPAVTATLQTVLVIVGLIWSLLIMYRISRIFGGNRSSVLCGLLPHGAVAVVLAVAVINALAVPGLF